MSAPKTLLIVYHSLTGGTQQMAEAARAGAAAEDGVTVRLLHAADQLADALGGAATPWPVQLLTTGPLAPLQAAAQRWLALPGRCCTQVVVP